MKTSPCTVLFLVAVTCFQISHGGFDSMGDAECSGATDPNGDTLFTNPDAAGCGRYFVCDNAWTLVDRGNCCGVTWNQTNEMCTNIACK